MGTAFDFAGNVLMVKVEGELDHHAADGLRESVDRTFDERGMRHIIFDFSGVTMMDSSGIGFVMGRYKKTNEIGGRTLLAGSNPYVIKVLGMAGVFSIVERCSDVQEALKTLGTEAK
ncbi:MAG: anti-sigma factor antagonist [Bacillota bacterium]|nr:anti-sigma factor antagonist [Bacillota bacterium]